MRALGAAAGERERWRRGASDIAKGFLDTKASVKVVLKNDNN